MSFIATVIQAFASVAVMADVGADIAREEAERLAACREKIEVAPDEAYEDGLAWLLEGSRPGARYCTALALLELGQEAEAAHRLEMLANAPDGGTLEQRGVYLAQSGNAWLAAGLPDAALVTLNNAVRLSPSDPAIYRDRARAHILLENWRDAESDLNAALGFAPDSFDAYYLRAKALLAQEQYDRAMADVTQARSLDPENVDILVLRGDIREAQRLKGLR